MTEYSAAVAKPPITVKGRSRGGSGKAVVWAPAVPY